MFFLDAHTHFYPEFSAEVFINSAFNNAHSLFSKKKLSAAGMIFTERNDCDFYSRITEDDSLKRELSSKGIRVEHNVIHHSSYNFPLVCFPGRQISTKEKIEVLALFHSKKLPENLSLNELITYIKNENSIPVINWAPGKWSGSRGKIVEQYINDHSQKITLGITTLLPELIPYPSLLKKGMALHIPIIAGSDPLPFRGQDKLPLSYGMLFNSISEIPSEQEIAKSIKTNEHTLFGKRSSISSVICRVFINEFHRKR